MLDTIPSIHSYSSSIEYTTIQYNYYNLFLLKEYRRYYIQFLQSVLTLGV